MSCSPALRIEPISPHGHSRKSFDEIGSVQLPAILLLHDRQACILVEKNITLNEYKILLPQSGSGEKVITRDELEKLYTGYAIFVRPKYLTDKKSVADATVR